MANKTNSTKVVTGIVRLSYANVWEPASINGSNPKYSVSLIIPKSDTKTIADINAAVDAAIKDGERNSAAKYPIRQLSSSLSVTEIPSVMTKRTRILISSTPTAPPLLRSLTAL